MANLLIRNKSIKALTLNESYDENGRKRYIFSGIFTPISGEKNRNGRIYDKDEVLKHISYLRERIRQDGCLLGELDHPESRFEIELKSVSHKIVDLWYDANESAVMGKLELLDTPNGKIAEALVDAGCPLFVSSRAAGSVGSDSHVHIQQMFTYDIVATPGFKEARLDQVAEALKPQVTAFLNESLQETKKENVASKYNINDSNILIQETAETFKSKMNSMNKINEQEIEKPLTDKTKTPEQTDGTNAANALGVPTAKIEPVKEGNGDEAEKPDKAEGAEDKKDSSADDSKEEDKKEPAGTSEDADLIVDIKPKYESDILSVEGEFNDDKEEDKDASEGEDKDKDASEGEDKDKKDVKECSDSSDFSLGQADEIKKENDETLKKYDGILDAYKKKSEVKESIIAQYPFSVSLSESNFSKFSQLLDDDKTKVAQFIFEQQVYDIQKINEIWDAPLKEEIKNKNKWMQLASEEDKKLYNEAPKEIQDSIAESAKYFELKTKADVDLFWANTGLREMRQQQIVNERFVEDYKKMVNPEAIQARSDLPYTAKYIEAVGNMLK